MKDTGRDISGRQVDTIVTPGVDRTFTGGPVFGDTDLAGYSAPVVHYRPFNESGSPEERFCPGVYVKTGTNRLPAETLSRTRGTLQHWQMFIFRGVTTTFTVGKAKRLLVDLVPGGERLLFIGKGVQGRDPSQGEAVCLTRSSIVRVN